MDDIDPRLNEIKDCLYRVANKAVIVKDGKLLITREKEGYYSLPGGGFDYGESVAGALTRELKEEIGIDANDVEIGDAPIHMANDGVINGIPRFMLFYPVKLVNDKVQEKELSFKWVSPDELSKAELSPSIASSRDFLADYVRSNAQS